jgi:hypothetical protein
MTDTRPRKKLSELTATELDQCWQAACVRKDVPAANKYEAEFYRRERGEPVRLPPRASPLVIDLQARIAERKGKPPSRPDPRLGGGRVDTGTVAEHPGDPEEQGS